MKRKYAYALVLLAALGGAASLTPATAEENLDPLKVAGDTHKLVLENAFVRVIESKVPAGKVEPKHSHPHGLTIALADYTVETTTFPDGKVTKQDRKVGGVVWTEAMVHAVHNVGKTSSHAIRIELKY